MPRAGDQTEARPPPGAAVAPNLAPGIGAGRRRSSVHSRHNKTKHHSGDSSDIPQSRKTAPSCSVFALLSLLRVSRPRARAADPGGPSAAKQLAWTACRAGAGRVKSTRPHRRERPLNWAPPELAAARTGRRPNWAPPELDAVAPKPAPAWPCRSARRHPLAHPGRARADAAPHVAFSQRAAAKQLLNNLTIYADMTVHDAENL
jgi:hypothetical protein